MVYIFIDSVPIAINNSQNVGGAYISCWINTDDIHQAEQQALQRVEQFGWKLVAIERIEIVHRSDYADENHEALQCFDEAVLDNEVYVFYRYPKDDADT